MSSKVEQLIGFLWDACFRKHPHLIKEWQEFCRLARLGAEVESLATGAGILRSREHGWRCIEQKAVCDPDAPPFYTCGAGDTAMDVAYIHRKES